MCCINQANINSLRYSERTQFRGVNKGKIMEITKIFTSTTNNSTIFHLNLGIFLYANLADLFEQILFIKIFQRATNETNFHQDSKLNT